MVGRTVSIHDQSGPCKRRYKIDKVRHCELFVSDRNFKNREIRSDVLRPGGTVDVTVRASRASLAEPKWTQT